MDKRNYAFDKMNYLLLAIGVAVVVVGFILMTGAGSTETTFNPDIFSARRIKVAPVVCFLGFIFIIYAVVRRPHDQQQLTSDAEDTVVKEDKTTNV